jgi:hypothetical protein
MPYNRRIVDDELDVLFADLPALSIEGPKAVGKTTTARQRAKAEFGLDEAAQRELVAADPGRLVSQAKPTLIDEWQRYPAAWDLVRRAVDSSDSVPGQFLLTGSATPVGQPTHSGAGRITTVRMRPLSFAERKVETPSVSLAALLTGTAPALSGQTSVGLGGYVDEILCSGFPGMRSLKGPALRAQLDGYLSRIVEKDVEEVGGRTLRRPDTLRRWMAAYAAATSTIATWETIRDAASGGHANKPSRATSGPYREVLEHLWILDDVPAWLPSSHHLSELSRAPKHQLADPALAARLVGIGRDGLLTAHQVSPGIPRDGTFLGALFESLAALSVRVYAQASEARVGHMRVQRGGREIDLIVEKDDQRVVALEVKLAHQVEHDDVEHLVWLRDKIGDRFLDGVVITTGPYAYRRPDGIAVVPLALLGP